MQLELIAGSECIRYPKTEHANSQGNGRETVAFRRHATARAQIRQACWAALADLEGSRAIWRASPQLAEVFRCDAYGNVVSIRASACAVCAFEVDHLFPWSRSANQDKLAWLNSRTCSPLCPTSSRDASLSK